MVVEKERLGGSSGAREAWPAALCSAVDVFAVSNLDDEHDELLVLNRIDDPAITISDSIEILFTSQFLRALRTRIFPE
jgi:hypothetical protein